MIAQSIHGEVSYPIGNLFLKKSVSVYPSIVSLSSYRVVLLYNKFR